MHIIFINGGPSPKACVLSVLVAKTLPEVFLTCGLQFFPLFCSFGQVVGHSKHSIQIYYYVIDSLQKVCSHSHILFLLHRSFLLSLHQIHKHVKCSGHGLNTLNSYCFLNCCVQYSFFIFWSFFVKYLKKL